MRHHTTVLLPLLLAAGVAAQASKVVPPYFATAEGNRTHTYPFGRDNAALQVLVDAAWLTTQTGLVQAVAMRPEGSLTAIYTGYTKNYKVTMWTTATTAAAMIANPTTNIGTATPTVVFNGPLTLPTASPRAILPAPFSVRIALTTPYVFNGGAGNLLMQLETADTVVPPSSYSLDAAFLRSTTAELATAQVSRVCANGLAQSLSLVPSRTSGVLGSTLDMTLRASTPGAFPQALVFLGTDNAGPGYPIDLGVIGMSGCTLNTDIFALQVVLATSGLFPTVQWPLPAMPQLANLPVYVQALGWANPPATFANSVTSEAFVALLHPGPGYPIQAQSIFYVASTNTWSMGSGGGYLPVLNFEGVFP
ncbi:MAG: hypothetical protein IT458_14480 [Planctomycetes bacterium]|nr:hypothetical protein [Planctomycetota bacterium]